VVLIREMDRVPWEFGPEFEGYVLDDWDIRGNGDGINFVFVNRISGQVYLFFPDDSVEWDDNEDLLAVFLEYLRRR